MLSALPFILVMASQPLLDHLISQGATRAAARLGAASISVLPEESAAEATKLFTTAAPITLVDNQASAAQFVDAMNNLPSESTIALDAEWRPDLKGYSRHRPSLLQLAVLDAVWLLDFESAAVLDATVLLAVASVLASSSIRLLGFSLQTDLDKLQLLFTPERGFADDFKLEARRVVDLRTEAEMGLSTVLSRWTGLSLDKAMQCSDWSIRPLSSEQITYAAADAACLHALDAALAAAAAAAGPDLRVERELLVATTASSGADAARSTASAGDHADAADAALMTEGLERVRAASQRFSDGSARVVRTDEIDSSSMDGRLEVNALCFTCPACPLLVLTPADERIDTRWLALALNAPKRRVKLASFDECEERFGAIAGLVPPVPLRPGVRVLCHPRLADAENGLWASAADPAFRLLIDSPRETLPALTKRAAANDGDGGGDSPTIHVLDGTAANGGADLPPFAWLPSPSLWCSTLEDALANIHTMREDGPVFIRREASSGPVYGQSADDDGDDDGSSLPDVKLIVDPSLSVLARKLRMVGLDTQVAGEVIKPHQETGMMISPAVAAVEAAANGADNRDLQNGGSEAWRNKSQNGVRRVVGLLRVGIEASNVEGQYKRSAIEGRLIVTTAKQKKLDQLPGAAYRLLSTEAGAQFAEVLAVLGMSDAVEAGGSRCGICNGDAWLTLTPDQVEVGQVPPAVLRKQDVFYKCGCCMQIFWPGEKYESTMEGLRAEGREQQAQEAADAPLRTAMWYREQPPAVEPPRAGTAGGVWRPPSGTVRSVDSAMRAGSVHTTQRMQLNLD